VDFGDYLPRPLACRALPYLLGAGWQLNTILTIPVRTPIPIVNSNDTSGTFIFTPAPERGSRCESNFLQLVTVERISEPSCFQPAGGRYVLEIWGATRSLGPGFHNLDFSATKDFRLR